LEGINGASAPALRRFLITLQTSSREQLENGVKDSLNWAISADFATSILHRRAQPPERFFSAPASGF
jgi:hypothetical protein